MATQLEQRVRFDRIRYANCWEDPALLCAALEPAPGKRILSIASGGDNALALLAAGADVVAADLSRAQLACVELKCLAIRRLGYEEALAFLGIRPSQTRVKVYHGMRRDLSGPGRDFWDWRLDPIDAGIIHAGKFEDYFRLFRTRALPFVHGRRTVARLLQEKDRAAREEFYERAWNTLRWRLLFRIFFSRFVMGRLGRDPEFFRHVEGSVADRILARARHALTVLPTHNNPYLDYILTGNFTRTVPPYLEPGRFDILKQRLDCLTLHRGTVEEAAQRHRGPGFDGFNLSDIFEYLDEETADSVYGHLLDTAKPGARFAYWNMLVPRSCPPALAARIRARRELAAELFRKDRAFFYNAFVVEEVVRT